jgi:hypothetical protein
VLVLSVPAGLCFLCVCLGELMSHGNVNFVCLYEHVRWWFHGGVSVYCMAMSNNILL